MALHGIKVLEIAGLAPAPFCGMVLADFGATVIRVDRVGSFNPDTMSRGKKSISLNLKKPQGRTVLLDLVKHADVLIEPFRPGVMEKLGLGPDALLACNPRLIFARLTGFGQKGPYASMAGHDINYIAISGALSLIGRAKQTPVVPFNVLGDFAGGGMLCVLGILLSLMERHTSGKGQVVDSAMIDGASYLSMFAHTSGLFSAPKGENMLDGGAPWYDTYATKDGEYIAVGALEPQFYAQFLNGLGLASDDTLPDQHDRDGWPVLRKKFTELFSSRTRSEWCAVFDGTDACVTPVLNKDELQEHKHHKARGFIYQSEQDGWLEPEPAPRLSRTPGRTTHVRPEIGQHTRPLLQQMLGYSDDQINKLKQARVLGEAAQLSAKL